MIVKLTHFELFIHQFPFAQFKVAFFFIVFFFFI